MCQDSNYPQNPKWLINHEDTLIPIAAMKILRLLWLPQNKDIFVSMTTMWIHWLLVTMAAIKFFYGTKSSWTNFELTHQEQKC